MHLATTEMEPAKKRYWIQKKLKILILVTTHMAKRALPELTTKHMILDHPICKKQQLKKLSNVLWIFTLILLTQPSETTAITHMLPTTCIACQMLHTTVTVPDCHMHVLFLGVFAINE